MRTATALAIAAALSLGATGAWAQQKQKVSYKVGAENTKYPQRHTLEVGDEPGHTVALYEIHRSFAANAPVVNGVKLKETWTPRVLGLRQQQRPQHELPDLRREKTATGSL